MTHSDAPSQRRPAVRRRWLWPVLLLVLVLLGMAAAWRVYSTQQGGGAPAATRGGGRRGGPQAGGGPDQAQAVGVAAAVTGDIPIMLSQLGTVTPLATVTVKSQLSGYLTQIAFREGQMVKKGDFLAQIDSRPYEAALAQYQGQLLRDQALLKNAQLDLVRYQKLNAQDSISKQNVDTQAATVGQYQGTVKSDQAQIDAQKLNIAYCHIVSPIDGRVGLRQVDQGNYVTSGDSNGIVVVTQLEPISVVFTMPEDALPQVAKRLRAGDRLPVTAFDRSNTTQLATGTVETVDNQIDTTTGTIKVRATFDNKDDILFPNQFVNARVLVDTLRGAIIVPTAAIQRGTDGPFVYIVKEDSTVSVRPVKTGAASGDKTALLSGVQVGERVVTDGSDRLREGQKVVIPPPPGAPAAASGSRAGGRTGGRPAAAAADPATGSAAAGSTAAADTAAAGAVRGNPPSAPGVGSERATAEGVRPPAAAVTPEQPNPRRDPTRQRRPRPADPAAAASPAATAP